ncbi:MAG TPA: sulfur oxidation c-type cytochrome SoxA [Xanthobacteraceae bacterium]|nr:sulfur oxidation c-type cytochrome SoxA [Xanthobacteraceae bacterium]
MVLTGIATAVAGEIAPADRKSGYDFMSAQARAMQDDDTANPGMLSVLDGEASWNKKAGAAQKSCADCHGDATTSMQGVAARYPAYDAAHGRPITLPQRINLCRSENQKATPFPAENAEWLALSAFVGQQSRGMPITPPDDSRLAATLEKGRALYFLRQGQLNLSCAQCHDDNWQQKLSGNPIQQGQATGYPVYRLEWQGMGSLERRLRNCMFGVRAEPFAYGSEQHLALALYLRARAAGLKIETPAVRP